LALKQEVKFQLLVTVVLVAEYSSCHDLVHKLHQVTQFLLEDECAKTVVIVLLQCA